jgi:hypothetical protein
MLPTFSLAAGAKAQLEVKAVLVGISCYINGFFQLGLCWHLLVEVRMDQRISVHSDVSAFKLSHISINKGSYQLHALVEGNESKTAYSSY